MSLMSFAPSLSADLGGLGAAGSLAGGILGGIGAENAGAAQAQADQQNALMAGIQSANDWETLLRQNQQTTWNENATLGAQKAEYGAAGVNPLAGTPQAVAGSTEAAGNFQRATRLLTGAALGSQANQQVQADQAAARAARQAGNTGMFSAVLGGVGGALKLATPFLMAL